MSVLVVETGQTGYTPSGTRSQDFVPCAIDSGGRWNRLEREKNAAARFQRAAASRVRSQFVLYLTLTSICLGFASSFFGRVRRNMPSLNWALIASVSTLGGSVNDL